MKWEKELTVAELRYPDIYLANSVYSWPNIHWFS